MKLKINHKVSLWLFWLGAISGSIAGLFHIGVGTVLVGAAIIQMFIFCKCPHCGYGLYNVSGLPGYCPRCGEDLFPCKPKK